MFGNRAAHGIIADEAGAACPLALWSLGGLLDIAIRCASPRNKIELRAKVAAQGNVLTGSWEERTFNASGNVTGHAKDDEISLSIDGGGFTASMVVKHLSAQQTVVITAKGVAFTKVSLSLARGRS